MAARPDVASMRGVVGRAVAVARRGRAEHAEEPGRAVRGARTRCPLDAGARDATIRELEQAVAQDLTSKAVGASTRERRARARTRERTVGAARLEAAAHAAGTTARLPDPSRSGTDRLAELVGAQLSRRTRIGDACGAACAAQSGRVRRLRASAAASRGAGDDQRQQRPERTAGAVQGASPGRDSDRARRPHQPSPTCSHGRPS